MSKKMKIEYSINAELCSACATCIRSCPISIALIPGDKYFMIDSEYCIQCGHCAGVCPSNAVVCNRGEMEVALNPQFAPHDMESFLLEKRSVRNYKDLAIDEEVLQTILKIGRGTATASNLHVMQFQSLTGEEVQSASFAVANEFSSQLDKLKNPLSRFFLKFGSLRSYTRPRFVQFLEEQMTQTLNGNIDRIFFKAPAVILVTYPKSNRHFGRVDAALAGAHMMMMARSQGLESCVVGYADKFSQSSKAVRKSLKIQKGHEVGIVFSLGYPRERYYRVPFHA